MKKTQQAPHDNKFLGTEKIGKLLRMFAIPCVLSLVIQALYNIVDQIFIGNCDTLGSLGNTATGIVYPLTVVALAIGLFLGDGSSAIISINQGKNNTKETHRTIGTALSIGFIVSIIFLVACFIFRDGLLTGLGSPEMVMPFAKDYSTWIFIGFPFFILGTIINPVIRADGSPKFAMFSMIIGAVVNIVLDPIFIFGLKMGMNGAALATALAQIITFVLSVGYLFKSKTFKLKLKSFVPNFKFLGASLKLGISSFLTQISIVIVAIVNNKILSAYLPHDQSAIGLLTIAFKIFGIILSASIGVAAGGQPILGYNYGAKKFDRVRETYKKIMIITLIIGICATILFEACPQVFLQMFGYGEFSSFGLNTFRIYLSCILLTCLTKVTAIFFQSIGMPVRSTLTAMLRDVIFLVPLSLLLPLANGIDSFLWSAPIADVLTFIVAIVFVVKVFSSFKKFSTEDARAIAGAKILPSRKGVIVTISREHGAGGREIGKVLAEKLGVPFYDKSLALLVAKESGLASEFVENIEQNGSLLYSLYLSTDVNQTAISAQDRVLRQIAEKGSCVIVGRAGDYVLKEFNPCKVLIYAPLDYKVSRVMKNYGDDEKQAKQNIQKSDYKRAMFYKNVTGQNWSNRDNYNLCLDGSIGVEECADVIYNYILSNRPQPNVVESGVEKKYESGR